MIVNTSSKKALSDSSPATTFSAVPFTSHPDGVVKLYMLFSQLFHTLLEHWRDVKSAPTPQEDNIISQGWNCPDSTSDIWLHCHHLLVWVKKGLYFPVAITQNIHINDITEPNMVPDLPPDAQTLCTDASTHLFFIIISHPPKAVFLWTLPKGRNDVTETNSLWTVIPGTSLF